MTYDSRNEIQAGGAAMFEGFFLNLFLSLFSIAFIVIIILCCASMALAELRKLVGR